MSVRSVYVWFGAALIVSVSLSVAALMIARQFYFNSKLAAVEPVRFSEYFDENAAWNRTTRNRHRERPTIVLIGDSRMRAMICSALQAEWEVLNRGVSGETSAQMLLRFQSDAINLRPDLIVIQSGINDLVAGMGAKDRRKAITANTISNLKNAAAQAAASGSKVILLTVIPPARPEPLRRLVWDESIRDEVAFVNRALSAWGRPEGVSVLNLSEVFGSEFTLSHEFALDTLHLNDAGNEKLCRRFEEFFGSPSVLLE